VDRDALLGGNVERTVAALVASQDAEGVGRRRACSPDPAQVSAPEFSLKEFAWSTPWNTAAMLAAAYLAVTRATANDREAEKGTSSQRPTADPAEWERDPPSARRAGDHTSDLHRPRHALVEMAP
jgi:hypothetical protein